MSSYYYLVASLPMLRYDETAPMTQDAFLALCDRLTSASDAAFIRAASLLVSQSINDSYPPFLRSWNGFLRQLQRELSDKRAKKLSIDDQRYRNTEEKQPRIEEAVRMAMGAETPLQGELVLLQLLWKYVDDLSIGHVFDVEFLLAYHLKLQLLIRKELFSPMEGNAEFKRLFSNLQTNIKSI